MNNFFTPLTREKVHYHEKPSADGENWIEFYQIFGRCFKLKIENFREVSSDHLLSVNVNFFAILCKVFKIKTNLRLILSTVADVDFFNDNFQLPSKNIV